MTTIYNDYQVCYIYIYIKSKLNKFKATKILNFKLVNILSVQMALLLCRKTSGFEPSRSALIRCGFNSR